MKVVAAPQPPPVGAVSVPCGTMLHELKPRQVVLTMLPLPGSAPLHEGVTAKGPFGQLPVGPP